MLWYNNHNIRFVNRRISTLTYFTQKLKCNGNQKHNAKLEMNLPLNAKKPVPYSHINDKEQFIIQKYQNISSETKSTQNIELKRSNAYPFIF